MPDGRLMVALPSAGEILQVSPDGTQQTFVDGLIFPNGVYADFTDTLWVTDSDKNEVLRVSAEGEGEVDVVVASGDVATGPNGVVYDELRRSLFFATGMYLDHMSIVRIDFDENGVASDPVVVIALDDANGDGVAMDGCGNIYFADNHSPSGTANEDKTTKIRRLRLDGAGDLLDSEIIAEMPGSITNFQWGSGPGFDPESLYTIGFRGVSYQINVGVLGAPVPVPDFSN
jgi:sugar lactone lactonase YvrE